MGKEVFGDLTPHKENGQAKVVEMNQCQRTVSLLRERAVECLVQHDSLIVLMELVQWLHIRLGLACEPSLTVACYCLRGRDYETFVRKNLQFSVEYMFRAT